MDWEKFREYLKKSFGMTICACIVVLPLALGLALNNYWWFLGELVCFPVGFAAGLAIDE